MWFTPKNILISVLVISLVMSLLGGVMLFKYAQHYYRLLNKTQLDPLGLMVYRGENRMEQKQSGEYRVVFFGDSRAFQWPEPDPSGSSDTDLSFINRGINGQTSAQVMGRVDQDILPLQADVVVAQFCVNDLKSIGLFDGSGDFILQQCQQRILDLVDQVSGSGGHLILTTLFPYGTVPFSRDWAWSEEIETATRSLNKFLLGLKGKFAGVTVMDAHALLVGSNDRINPEYSRDLLHLNTLGYEVLNKELMSLLVNLSAQKATVSGQLDEPLSDGIRPPLHQG